MPCAAGFFEYQASKEEKQIREGGKKEAILIL
jgi:hypothetical protein